jgi:hypothetical protein
MKKEELFITENFLVKDISWEFSKTVSIKFPRNMLKAVDHVTGVQYHSSEQL